MTVENVSAPPAPPFRTITLRTTSTVSNLSAWLIPAAAAAYEDVVDIGENTSAFPHLISADNSTVIERIVTSDLALDSDADPDFKVHEADQEYRGLMYAEIDHVGDDNPSLTSTPADA
jgi:hypothetical protein